MQAPSTDALTEQLQGFRFERVPQKVEKGRKEPSRSAKDKEPSRAKRASHRGDDAQPRVLVERKELQALQSERRTLFSRIDDAAAEARALRDEVAEREETMAASRVSAAQQQEVWARHDALRVEERDQARAQAAQAEDRARLSGEARAAAEADRARLREQLAVSEAEGRRAQVEATRATQQLVAAQTEARKAEDAATAVLAQVKEELARERERAAAAEARCKELEPEKESAAREVAALSERLTAALSERRALEDSVRQVEEMRELLRAERDSAKERAEHAEARADKFQRQRAEAVGEAQQLAARIAGLEASAVAATEAKDVDEERLQRETAALRTHIEFAESRGRQAERRCDALMATLEKERHEALRTQTALARAEERLMEERVRGQVAEERWGPLLRQRDEAQRERARAARALSAMHAERRELEWAVSDLGRRHTAAGLAGAPSRAWDAAMAMPTSGGVLGGGTLRGSARTAEGLAATPYAARAPTAHLVADPTAHSTFRTSPYGMRDAPSPIGRYLPTDIGGVAEADAAVAAARAVSPIAGLAAAAAAARCGSAGLDQCFAAEVAAMHSRAYGAGGALEPRITDREDAEAFQARLEAAAAWPPSGRQQRTSEQRTSEQRTAEQQADLEMERRLGLERAAASAADPASTPWTAA